MRRINTKSFALCALLLTAACASTSKGRELQAAEAIIGANKSATTAVTWGIITPDEGQQVRDITLVAQASLKRAIDSRRAGLGTARDALLDAVFDAIEKVAVIMQKAESK